MKIYPKSLCFLTTRKCTAACENCCFGCSPRESAFLPVEKMHAYIDQAKDIPSIKSVIFSGGECFLLGKKLDELVAHANDNSYTTRFVSNGYWATTHNAAKRKLQSLIKCGLKEANFSTGDNHMRYVDPKRVRIAAIECVNLGLKPYIVIELFKGSQFPIDDFFDDKVFSDYVEQGKISLTNGVWMKTNKSSKIDYSQKTKESVHSRHCDSMFSHISINTEYNVGLCCGLTIESLPELYAGKLTEGITLKQLLDDMPADFLKVWLRMKGPRDIINYARSYDPSIPLYNDKLHICDLCKQVYMDRRVRRVISRHTPKFKDFIIKSFYNDIIYDNISPDGSSLKELLSYKIPEKPVSRVESFKLACR